MRLKIIDEFMDGDVKETIINYPLGDKYEVWIPAYATEYINKMSKEKLEKLVRNINNEKEDTMKEEISIDFDFVGGIRKLDNHYLVKAGCHLFICDNLKEVSRRIKKALEEAYEDET